MAVRLATLLVLAYLQFAKVVVHALALLRTSDAYFHRRNIAVLVCLILLIDVNVEYLMHTAIPKLDIAHQLGVLPHYVA